MPIRTLLLGVVAVEAVSLLLELPQATSRAEAVRAAERVRNVFIVGLYQSAMLTRRRALE
jgi:hypothetical protein